MELKSTLMASSTPINKNKIMAIKHSKKTISTILSHTIIHTSIGDQANKSRYLFTSTNSWYFRYQEKDYK